MAVFSAVVVLLFAVILAAVWHIRTHGDGWRIEGPDDCAKAYAESPHRTARPAAGLGDVTREIG